ncbi:uncharacterized protein [Haliotis asinina]|uniref:uncharacterized protein n=1 Tax=Haliotis asinina TaxID=109174 RepID=UPI0035322504
MADTQGKIFFVYAPEGGQPSSREKCDQEKGLDENFSEVFGVLSCDGYKWCHDNLGDGAPAEEYENLECRLETWDVQTRNSRLEELDLSAEDILCSDIYEVHSKELVLQEDVTINVPVNIPKSYVPPGEMYDFYLKILKDGEWVFVHAVYKHGCVRAHLDSIQLLTVIARLKPERTTITPEGVEFVSDKDPDVKIEFPKGAVEEDAEFRFVTETVDPKRSSEYRKYNPNTFQSIMGFSTTVNVQHNLKGELQTRAKVTLPIHECKEDGGDEEVVFLRWHDGKVDIVDDVPTKEEGCYSISVKGFSAYSAVRVRSASVSRSEILTAARFLSGRENLCTLLCFINNKGLAGLPVLLVDVVESCRADVVAEEHRRAGLEEISMSRSRDIPVADRERIRIELGGDITYAPGIPRQAYALVFVKAAKKNHVTFPVKVKVSSTPFSIITFIGNRSQWTHRVHFNVNRGTKSSKNLLSQPRNTIGSAVSHSGPSVTRSGSSKSRSGSATGSLLSNGRRRSVTSLGSKSDVSERRQRLASCSSASSNETTPSMMSSFASLSSISEDGAFEEKRHPALCEKSLLVLSEQQPWSEWQKTAIELGMTLTQVERISEEASGRHISPAFRMLHRWIATNSGKSDSDLINDLACAFREFSRNDLADVLMVAEKDRLPLRRRDFLN